VARWYGRRLVPLNPPGPRAQIHRSFEQQREDFQRLRSLLAAEGVANSVDNRGP
jgi:hypothetical protein